jgi:uncharacterized cupredoxin-like copper-binding protein
VKRISSSRSPSVPAARRGCSGSTIVVDVPAGETKTLDYTFTTAGPTLIGCHTQGHYKASMMIDVTVEP